MKKKIRKALSAQHALSKIDEEELKAKEDVHVERSHHAHAHRRAEELAGRKIDPARVAHSKRKH